DADYFAVAFGGLDVDYARAAAALQAVFVSGSAFAVAVFGYGEDQPAFNGQSFISCGGFYAGFGNDAFDGRFGLLRIFRSGGHADDVVVFVEVHAAHSVGGTAHGADVAFVEADGLAVMRG